MSVPPVEPSTVPNILGAPAATADTTSTDKTQLSSDQFLKLLVAQLQYQDPTSPADMNSFMQQTATLNQVEQATQMTQAIQDMLTAQRSQTASSLVGRTVSYTDATGATVSGVVSSASVFGSTMPTVKVGDTDVALTNIQTVSETPAGTSGAATH